MVEKEISEEDLKNMSAEEIAELQKQNCIFCKIAEKQIPAKIVHEDSDCICILDINPASEGHILVFPKKHYMIMPHVPEDILDKMFKNVELMSHTLLKTLQCRGTTVFVANGVAAGQRAPHVLIHVFPRRENDGLVQLPKYEMNNEQISKLKSMLKPYITQVFGGKKSTVNNIKEAEFIEKKNEKMEEDIVNEEVVKELQNDEIEKKKLKKDSKKKSDDKGNSTKNTKEKNQEKKVDLDDITRLFG